jgi:hypothetical protein
MNVYEDLPLPKSPPRRTLTPQQLEKLLTRLREIRSIVGMSFFEDYDIDGSRWGQQFSKEDRQTYKDARDLARDFYETGLVRNTAVYGDLPTAGNEWFERKLLRELGVR